MSRSPILAYGIDAAPVVRNLAVIGALLLLASRALPAIAHLPWLGALIPPARSAGGAMLAMAGWMLACSLWLKQRVMRRLLAMHEWRGDELVLDVGCGRGLATVAAAARVPHGHVTAIDIWRAEDLSGNSPAALRANAAAAGVAARVTIETGDARALPFADRSFDVVASMTVLHNIAGGAARARAIADMWRVLRPGGRMLIFDIMHARTYARQLRALGAAVEISWPILLWGIPGQRICAVKPPEA